MFSKLSTTAKTLGLSMLISTVVNSTLMAKELTILVDASRSNPMLIDPAFNKRAAQYSFKMIEQLDKGDSIKVQTFGSLQSADNFAVNTVKLSRHNRKKIAKAVAKHLMALPERIKPQGSTNLLAWFNRNPIDCRKDSNTIMIITDAIEASEYVNPNKLLNGTQSLPEPSDFVNIRGCNVVMFGIGAGRSDKETIHLRKMWGRYFEQTGANFIAVPL